MIERLRLITDLWPAVAGGRVDLQWRDPRRGCEPDQLDRLAINWTRH